MFLLLVARVSLMVGVRLGASAGRAGARTRRPLFGRTDSGGGGELRVSVEIDGWQRFGEAKKAMHDAVEGALDELADAAVDTAKARAPVRTGRLRDSIDRTSLEGSRGEYRVAVFTDVEYARHLEYGTVFVNAAPYMRPTVRASRKRVASEVEKRFPKRL